MKKKLILRVFTLLMACVLSFGLLACLSGCNKVTGKPFVVDGVTYELSHWATANDEWIALHILDCGGQTEITLPTMYEDTVIESFGGFHSNNENATTEGLDKVKTLVVPEGYKVLRSGACNKMINLESLILPQSLEKIESNSISGPQRLRTLTLPSNLKEIDYEAFANKKGVSIVEICNLSSL
ncbi:MAG: leucine-rich repeat protein [Clostridia bacterium]|nr:leucine-rich repeat protein [Clostridia bacterium]